MQRDGAEGDNTRTPPASKHQGVMFGEVLKRRIFQNDIATFSTMPYENAIILIFIKLFWESVRHMLQKPS